MAADASEVRPKLETARKDLLHLGLRNPLTNFRPLKARRIEVVDELPVDVFRLLVVRGEKMFFLPAPDNRRFLG